MTNNIGMTAYRLMAEAGLSARELAEMDMDAYARATGRPTPTQAALQALGAQATQTAPEPPAALPDTTFTQQAVPDPHGRTLEELALTDDQMFHVWRAHRKSGGEGIGLLNQGGQSWAEAARAKAGRSAMAGDRNTVQPPRLEGRYLNHEAQRDTRTLGERFNVPGNSNTF